MAGDNLSILINSAAQNPRSDPAPHVNGLSFSSMFQLMPMMIIIFCLFFIMMLSLTMIIFLMQRLFIIDE